MEVFKRDASASQAGSVFTTSTNVWILAESVENRSAPELVIRFLHFISDGFEAL